MEKKVMCLANDMDKIMVKGLHLDLSRHFLPCKTILEVVKMMQTLGFNTLHLHFSDDPSFALKSSRHPEITNDRMLSIQEQEDIASACQAAAIEIIPEIDIPGHATALLHCLHPSLPVVERLGVVTSNYIDIDSDLPIILDLFEEYATRFHSRFIHMGGDEADGFIGISEVDEVGFQSFAKLLKLVSAWAREHNLWVIAWDECAKHLAKLPTKLGNFVIQQWRMCHIPKDLPVILSEGYYLDHLDDPIDYYNRSPKDAGPNIGCIACTWTEMIDEHNIWCSLLPTLYMLALRWHEYPAIRAHLPVALYEACEKYGYPQVAAGMENSWKTRLFVDYYQDHPRSITSVTKHQPLDREHDHYPTCAKKLVKTQWVLYRHLIMHEQVPEPELSEALLFVQEAIGKSAEGLRKTDATWLAEAEQLVAKSPYIEKTYKNGVVKILRRLITSARH